MKNWDSLSSEKIANKLNAAIDKNRCYISGREQPILGLPGTFLEQRIFEPTIDGNGNVQIDYNNGILQAYLKVLFHNPNHIGNHTVGDPVEPFFQGTHEIEKELLALCAENILSAQENTWSGYVATGGTEANIHALFVLREYFLMKSECASIDEIVIICSEDTHYSIDKAAKILSLDICRLAVDQSRQINVHQLSPKPLTNQNQEVLNKIRGGSKKYYIVVANMGTTMFGSVDQVEVIDNLISELVDASIYKWAEARVHVDAAFGGFVYPFTSSNQWNFDNAHVMSFTLDPHKMLQAPYNSGIYLAKNQINDITYSNPEYVPGKDRTLVGSRSGAASVFAWIVLMLYGANGGREFLNELVLEAVRIEGMLNRNIERFHESGMNVIAIYKNQFSDASDAMNELIDKYGLHHNNECFNITIMDHAVTDAGRIKKINRFIEEVNSLSLNINT